MRAVPKSTLAAVFCAAVLALGASNADARKQKQSRYVGIHPISAELGGGFCYIEVPHVHVYGPGAEAQGLYREHEGYSHFVADPVAYGYDGPKHTYYGHHPVNVDVSVGGHFGHGEGGHDEYCYLDGPHYHEYEPPPHAKFEAKGGVHFYVGHFPDTYEVGKKRYHPKANAVMKKKKYNRPVFVEDPPEHWHGEGHGLIVVVDDHHGHHDDHVVVDHHDHHPVHGHGGVGVEVVVPVPTIEIGVGIGHHHHGHGHAYGHRKWKHKGHKRGRW